VDELERRVADVNTGISDAASRLTEQAPARELAIISVAATRLLEEYVESKKRDALTKAIRQSTPTIAEVCQHMREAMKLAARHVRQEYDERSFALANQLAGAGNLSVVQRREIVREMIALNDLYVTHLETLRTLDRAYQQLPEAHQELSLRGDESRTEEIRRLYDDGRRLQELYRRAREATRKEE